MCMWQEKLKMIDGIHKVKGFGDWILKYQISKLYSMIPASQVSVLGPGAEILSENTRHTEGQEHFGRMPY